MDFLKKLASLAVLSILLKNNYVAYYIGSKSRNEFHNEINPTNKLVTQDIHIFTNANTDEVIKIFPCIWRLKSKKWINNLVS